MVEDGWLKIKGRLTLADLLSADKKSSLIVG